jgi:hypothetical protein
MYCFVFPETCSTEKKSTVRSAPYLFGDPTKRKLATSYAGEQIEVLPSSKNGDFDFKLQHEDLFTHEAAGPLVRTEDPVKGEGVRTTAKLAQGSVLTEYQQFRYGGNKRQRPGLKVALASDTRWDISTKDGTRMSGYPAFTPRGEDGRPTGGLGNKLNTTRKHNCVRVWLLDVEKMVVVAIRDIKPGEELTLSYAAENNMFSARVSFFFLFSLSSLYFLSFLSFL